MFYLYIKSFHLISLIAWMVPLLYLLTLFVHLSTVLKINSPYVSFLLMEIKLIKFIAISVMISTFVFGIVFLCQDSDLTYENYFIIKLCAVFLFTIYQIYLIYIYKSFKAKNNKRLVKFYKALNEVPTILMIIIILLVVLKPNIG